MGGVHGLHGEQRKRRSLYLFDPEVEQFGLWISFRDPFDRLVALPKHLGFAVLSRKSARNHLAHRVAGRIRNRASSSASRKAWLEKNPSHVTTIPCWFIHEMLDLVP